MGLFFCPSLMVTCSTYLYATFDLYSGNHYEPVPTQYDAGSSIEEENDKMTDELKDKIHVLKSVSFCTKIICWEAFL